MASPRFDVALFFVDGTALTYHTYDYADLVQSLVDISPIAGTEIHAVAVASRGQPISPTFTARALRATGISRVIALTALGGRPPTVTLSQGAAQQEHPHA